MQKPGEKEIGSFNSPTRIPENEADRLALQKANYDWWNRNPMRYDWKEEIGAREFSREFFEEIDRRFFANAAEYLPKEDIPFDVLIDFDSLKDKDVLEIGVGNGSHAGLIASHARSFTGIDLTDYAVKSISERFRIFGLKGKVLKMDAERLEFPDMTFDLIWSWGVIHHSSNTRKILEEIHRVLRPGGRALIMVYHRGWWNYYVVGLLEGLVSGNLFRMRSLHKSIQLRTDGAIARYYTPRDWQKLSGDLFEVEDIFILGPKSDIVPFPAGLLKNIARRILPNRLNRFLTKNIHMGVFLNSVLRKPEK